MPCRIVFRETGIALRSDPNGTHPDPGQRIVRDSKGRFYTAGAQGFPFDIALWDADGTFLRSFGSAGNGPGELGTEGQILLKIDSRDRLHVKSANRRWAVFDPDQTFVRSVSSRALGEAAFLSNWDAILDNGLVMSANAGYFLPDSVFHFRLVDSTGVLVESFGVRGRQALAESPSPTGWLPTPAAIASGQVRPPSTATARWDTSWRNGQSMVSG